MARAGRKDEGKLAFYREQAELLGVSVSTIRSRVRNGQALDVKPERRRNAGHDNHRLCLMCGNMFPSTWIGNRRCIECDSKTIGIRPVDNLWIKVGL